MPQSLHQVYGHIVFSTKERVELIGGEVEKEHHKTMTFQEEFRRFLKQYGVDYDERYVWD